MGRACIVCKRTEKEIRGHKFPQSSERSEKWRKSLGITHVRVGELKKRHMVCTLHFAPEDYRNAESRMLNTTAVPTLHIFEKTALYTRPSLAASTETARSSSENIVPYSSSPEHYPEECKTEELEVGNKRLFDESAVSRMLNIPAVPILRAFEKTALYKEPYLAASTKTAGSSSGNIVPYSSPPEHTAEECKTEEVINYLTSDENANAAAPMHNLTRRPKYANASAQTEPARFLTTEEMVQDEIISEVYPDYVCRSKLTLIKELIGLKKKVQSLTNK